jgi:hypothetical protein
VNILAHLLAFPLGFALGAVIAVSTPAQTVDLAGTPVVVIAPAA